MAPPPALSIRRLHRRARRETIALEVIGFLALLVGIWALLVNPPEPFKWLMVLAIAGPVIIYMGFIAFYTYLEGIEEERYFPDR